jgi:hypothetical protein
MADDADVGVIAAHLARFAIDILQDGSGSTFPNSAYVIGLLKSWIFEQPFDTHPIMLVPTGSWTEDTAIAVTADLRELLRELTAPLVG